MAEFRDVYRVQVYEKFVELDLAALARLCLDKEQEYQERHQTRLSRVWDKYNFFDWQEPIVKEVADAFLGATREYLARVPLTTRPKGLWLDGWVNIARTFEYHPEHIHPSSVLSAILYVAVPDFDPGDSNFGAEPYGATCFSVERWTCGNPLWSNEIWVTPATGKLVVFPSNLPHYVAPNKSDAPRITVSTNINAG